MAVRGVIGVRDLEGLRETILTEGWETVDPRVRVSDTPVSSNASAVSSSMATTQSSRCEKRFRTRPTRFAHVPRRARPAGGHNTGLIRGTEGPDWMTVHVTNNGVGMAREVLTGSLLDFGITLWREPDVMYRIPGLAASSFETSGRFDIGLVFALFMFGRPVRVISRFHLASAGHVHPRLPLVRRSARTACWRQGVHRQPSRSVTGGPQPTALVF